MSTRFIRSAVLLVSTVLYGGFAVDLAYAGGDVHWGYDGETGPEHWAGLSPDFRLCRYGMNQSPIDIRETVSVDLGPLDFDYSTRATSVVNNGHTLQVNIEPGSFMRVEGDRFELDQIHFHSPSEHRVHGEGFPFEAHLVHRNGAGELAVVGVLFRLGEEHRDLTKLGALAPSKVGESSAVDFDLGILMTLHESQEAYFRYSGSLTTPPCSEGVRWFILKKISHISQRQVDRFVEIIGEDARGPQPQRARIVLEH
jgi:carbonic anhydrase